MPITPQVARLLAEWAAVPTTPVTELSAEKVRADDRAILDLQRSPPRLFAIEDVNLPGGQLAARLYRPRRGKLPTIIYFHGGGFVIGADGYDRVLRELAVTTGHLIVAPNVRLAPEHPFPAAVDDAFVATTCVLQTAAELGALPGRIGVGGDSSGGNLAAVVAWELGRQSVPLAFQVLVYPMLDATASLPSYRKFAEGFGFTREKSLWYFGQYLPEGVDPRDPRVSPLFVPSLEGLPPTLVITAEYDPLRDDGEEYARLLKNAGGNVELRRFDGVIHGFLQMTGAVDAAQLAQRAIANWLERQTSTSQRQ
jgi:acetyl esterase/lipase